MYIKIGQSNYITNVNALVTHKIITLVQIITYAYCVFLALFSSFFRSIHNLHRRHLILRNPTTETFYICCYLKIVIRRKSCISNFFLLSCQCPFGDGSAVCTETGKYSLCIFFRIYFDLQDIMCFGQCDDTAVLWNHDLMVQRHYSDVCFIFIAFYSIMCSFLMQQ